MRVVKYISGKSGKTFILNQGYSINIGEANPWSSAWTYESIKERFGETITEFSKDALRIPLKLKFRGSENGISQNLNEFFVACEEDIISKKEGRLFVDDEYISGFFIERQTEPSQTFYGYEQTIVFFAPYPFWIKELSRGFYPNPQMPDDGLDYNYNYNYDYALDLNGSRNWNNGHYAPSDFVMRIFGAVENPRIVIAGHPYQINVNVLTGEYITINTRKKTATLTKLNGVIQNVFKYRATDNSIFEKIPEGNSLITWNGSFGFEIVQHLERSEPRWI